VHNANNGDGRPRPIAAVVVIEPDDGHVMSRVVQPTEIDGTRYPLYRGIPLVPLIAQNVSTRPGRNITRFRRHAKALYLNLKGKYFFPTYVNFHHLCLRFTEDILFYFVVHQGGYRFLQPTTILVTLFKFAIWVWSYFRCVFLPSVHESITKCITKAKSFKWH